MPALAETQLSASNFTAFLEELHSLAARPSLKRIQAVMVRYGLHSATSRDGVPSLNAARTVRDGALQRYRQQKQSGQVARARLCAAPRDGVNPLDAVEEALSLELEHLVATAGPGRVDVKEVASSVLKLRTAISMREESRRAAVELERRVADSKAARDVEQRRLTLAENAAASRGPAAAGRPAPLSEEEKATRMRSILGLSPPPDSTPPSTPVPP